MLMPGESTGAADGPHLNYLRALSRWDRRFPGFGHDIHGVENRDGVYHVQCLKAASRKPQKRTAAAAEPEAVGAR
jgi:arginine decarboxylase